MLLRAALQTGLAFVLIYIVVRLIGKLEVGQGTFWYFVSAVGLGSLGASLATEGLQGVPAIATAVITWGLFSFSVGLAALQNRTLRGILEGKPTVIIQNGKILEDQMRRVRLDLDQMMGKLRRERVTSVSDVEYAVLETNGQLSVILKSQRQPVTPSDLKLPTPYVGLSTELIMDGQLVRQNLRQLNLSEEWLRSELARRGITDLNEVILAAMDTQGRLFVDLRRDQLKAELRPGDLPH